MRYGGYVDYGGGVWALRGLLGLLGCVGCVGNVGYGG